MRRTVRSIFAHGRRGSNKLRDMRNHELEGKYRPMYLGDAFKPRLQLGVYSFGASSPDGDIGEELLADLSSHPLVV